MKTRGTKDRLRRPADARRRGVAAIECALVLPILVALVLGVMDVGQFVDVGQTVENASRVGARRATRNNVTKSSDVKNVVLSYLADAYPNLTSSQINSATQVHVYNSTGVEIVDSDTGGALTTVQSGEAVTVKVSFQYDSVRWTQGFPTLGGKVLHTSTVMRRE